MRTGITAAALNARIVPDLQLRDSKLTAPMAGRLALGSRPPDQHPRRPRIWELATYTGAARLLPT